jgi:hypothetical protein
MPLNHAFNHQCELMTFRGIRFPDDGIITTKINKKLPVSTVPKENMNFFSAK